MRSNHFISKNTEKSNYGKENRMNYRSSKSNNHYYHNFKEEMNMRNNNNDNHTITMTMKGDGKMEKS